MVSLLHWTLENQSPPDYNNGSNHLIHKFLLMTDKEQEKINALLQEVATLQKQKSFLPEYQSRTSDNEALGLAISKYSKWDYGNIAEISTAAFEDSNFKVSL